MVLDYFFTNIVQGFQRNVLKMLCKKAVCFIGVILPASSILQPVRHRAKFRLKQGYLY